MNTRNLEIAGFCGLVLFIIYLAFSPRENDNLLQEVKAENRYYSVVNRQQDSLLNEVFTFLNQFEENLDSLQVSESMIYSMNQEIVSEASFQERIFTGLDQIKARLASNRLIIDSLESRMDHFGSENTELQKTVASLRFRLNQKTESIALLEQSLSDAYGRINSLGKQVFTLNEKRTDLIDETKRLKDTIGQHRATLSAQGKYIQSQEARLRQGFLISGNMKELKKSGVIHTAGGVAGIGSVPQLATELDQNEFVPIDIEHLTVIPINGEKAELVSSHPASSYKIITSGGDKRSVNTLEILKPADFWSTSRYLVVLTH